MSTKLQACDWLGLLFSKQQDQGRIVHMFPSPVHKRYDPFLCSDRKTNVPQYCSHPYIDGASALECRLKERMYRYSGARDLQQQ